MRRAASKVTVAYDASGLNEGVFVYLKSVQIRDIPKTCFLGNTNKIEEQGDLFEGEIIRYYEGEKPTFNENYRARLSSGKFTYGEHGITSDALILL